MSTTKYHIHSISEHIPYPLDLFICSASYEYRCRSVPDQVDFSLVKQSFVARNANPSEPLIANIKYLEDKIPSPISVKLNKNIPTIAADNFWEIFSELFHGPPKRALVDITTFTHEAVLILIRVLLVLARSQDEIVFSYVGAEEYDPGLPDEKKWLSKGIRDIRSVLGYLGELVPSRKIHLIVLVGHETDRVRSLIDSYEPSLLSIGYCTEESSISSKNFAANQHFHNKIVSLYPHCDKFSFSANDVFESQKAVMAQVRKFPNHNTVIAPMNSKLSAIGVALGSVENEEIQLCYAQPELYNFENYSVAKDICFLFKVPGIGKPQ